MAAVTAAASNTGTPRRRILSKERFSPTKNIRNTSPSWDAVWMRPRSVMKANGGVCGPMMIPASKYPTTAESPIFRVPHPATAATSRMTAKS